MQLTKPRIKGTLVRRYKRFLADVQLDSGELITVHTPNTGSMLGCAEPGSIVWIYDSQNPSRKYRWSWEMVETLSGVNVGINTSLANKLVVEAIDQGVIKELGGYNRCKTEVTFPGGKSRFDIFLADHASHPDCFVEVKNVTAIDNGGGTAIFPDAVTMRGAKHLRDLVEVVKSGMRAVMCYCVQREDAARFEPASRIDPVYSEALHAASRAGVEVVAYVARVEPDCVVLETPIPVVLR